ncbi:MAG: hypothetical protein JSV17_00100 [Candidatus Aminicenantes bacterium]|nr:MAG: hypothetical protein JSV17_00100 [Candidatus Aminicenantes bacterium]
MKGELIFIRKSERFLVPFLIIAFLTQCTPMYMQRLNREIKTISQINELDKDTPYLKVHMLDGQVYLLSKWEVNEENESISGLGRLLDLNRNLVEAGDFSISLQDVAIFETNTLKPSPAVSTMAVLSVLSLAVTVLCLANPKACFGSCPTFYAWNGEELTLQAEGFSSSVCPILEAEDVDALYLTKPRSQDLKIKLTNEALETHVIRQANILAVPRPENSRTFVTQNRKFYQAQSIHEPTKCNAQEGDCLAAVVSLDGKERFSFADDKNLATRETIDMEFGPINGDKLGLILGFRQTLLTTYLFYQGLAYMGNSAGYWFAKLQRGDENMTAYANSIADVLGGIEVFVQSEGNQWIPAGKIQETGPIATDTRMILMPELERTPQKIKLRMTKGLWRLDYIVLAELDEEVDPIRILPEMVFREGKIDSEARSRLIEPDKQLVTMPGDELTLVYELPTEYQHYELFLESQGYYLEWMRSSWIQEENLQKTITMFKHPEKFLRDVAPEYKKIERQMEEIFWRSKYVRKKN